VIIPGTLVVSASTFLPELSSFGGISGSVLVAIGTLIGTICGFILLMRYVIKGNPQAGLPLLNSGAIVGYFITYYLIYNDLTFGFKAIL
jgi:presenilin-like A22 family membrane protease